MDAAPIPAGNHWLVSAYPISPTKRRNESFRLPLPQDIEALVIHHENSAVITRTWFDPPDLVASAFVNQSAFVWTCGDPAGITAACRHGMWAPLSANFQVRSLLWNCEESWPGPAGLPFTAALAYRLARTYESAGD